MKHEDCQLLIRTHKGHEASARKLWERHAPRLLAYAASIVGRSDADDVVQGVFCSLLTLDRARITDVQDVGAWMVTLTRRAAINHLRTVRRERARRAGAARSETTASEFDPQTAAIHAAIDRLPRRLREIVIVKHMTGLSFDQAADALGLNRNTAASRYRSAIDRLRRLLGPQPAGEPTINILGGEPCVTI